MTLPVPPSYQSPPRSRTERALDAVPRLLASKIHIGWLLVLFVWLIPVGIFFPALAPDHVQLILGNYTNVTSDMGACIAAGAGLAVRRQMREHKALMAKVHDLTKELHAHHIGRHQETGLED